MSHFPSSPPNPANSPSARFFSAVGIEPGMRVLDVGCGNGDLSRYVATLAGPEGVVVGIDRSESALFMARAIEAQPSSARIEYRAVNLAEPLPDIGSFDAIVGRRVLMYLPDARNTLERLVSLLNPGGTMAFQEHARSNLPAAGGDIPLHRQMYDWAWNTVTAEGGDTTLALRLADWMRQLGLSVSESRCEAILMQPTEPSFLPTLVQAMLPRMIERGVVSAAEVDPDTLEKRIESERQSVEGAIVWDLAFLLSGQKPNA